MQYISTRNVNNKVSFSEALVKGIASDGGLFVPESFPKIDSAALEEMLEMSYEERVVYLLSLFATDFEKDELETAAKNAYSRFDGDPAPVVKMDDGIYILELFHGPTLAFKDMALTLFPQLLSYAKKKVGEEKDILILVATSGDTGKAALEGFKDVDGIKIMVFYPSEGVSSMQKLQMSSQEGENVFVAAIKGNFDNCQSGVKEIFADNDFKAICDKNNVVLSSANSINLGRLLPQVVYYFSAYLDLVSSSEIALGDKVDFSVPTGNFGDILAGWYAYKMGLPVNKLLCASNSNNVLTDFFTSGKYDKNRNFYKTISPSMDILISSNLERLLFEVSGRDDKYIAKLMSELKESGVFEVSEDILSKMTEIIYAGMATEEDTKRTIGLFFDEYAYLLDPHTAVSVYVSDNYAVDENDYSPMVMLSTASPFKFTQSVINAIGKKSSSDPFKDASTLQRLSAMEIPSAISELKNKTVRFNETYEIADMRNAIENFIRK